MFNPFNLRRPAHSRFSPRFVIIYLLLFLPFCLLLFHSRFQGSGKLSTFCWIRNRKWRWMVPTLPPKNLERKHIANSINFPFFFPSASSPCFFFGKTHFYRVHFELVSVSVAVAMYPLAIWFRCWWRWLSLLGHNLTKNWIELNGRKRWPF